MPLPFRLHCKFLQNQPPLGALKFVLKIQLPVGSTGLLAGVEVVAGVGFAGVGVLETGVGVGVELKDETEQQLREPLLHTLLASRESPLRQLVAQ